MIKKTYIRGSVVITATGTKEAIQEFEHEVIGTNLFSVLRSTAEELPTEVTPSDLKEVKEQKEEFMYPRGDKRILKNMPKDEPKASK
jgi:methylmalonyl-CoA mutase N-terminal domain/subunit